MSQISLKEFASEIRQRIDEERANEAIPMAQYLLRQYPRYLKGYELLAEAALQQGKIKDAIEVFRRVLSADPENLTAHRGMATAYAQEEEIGEALWYMMRAFEVDPRIRGIRQELRELYYQRDGRRPGRLNLNRAALARMYMREGLYHRAIEELNIELESGLNAPASDRVDLWMALAEAQWFANLRSDATSTAEKVRLELPYCLKANLILAEFYVQQGDFSSADIHLRIIEQMDPENELAVELFGESGFLQENRVLIESLDEAWKATFPLSDDDEHKMPEWLADLSLFATAEPEEQEVDWEAIVAYETNWRTILAKTTHDAIDNFVPNWRVDLRHATRLSLKERKEEFSSSTSKRLDSLPLISKRSSDQPEPAAPDDDWREPLRKATLTAFKDATAAEKAAAEKAAAEKAAAEKAAAEKAAAEKAAAEKAAAQKAAAQKAAAAQVIPSQADKSKLDWVSNLRNETLAELDRAKEVTPTETKEEAPTEAITKEQLAIGTAWVLSLAAATRAELEAAEQRREEPEVIEEVVEPAEITSVDWQVSESASWRSNLRRETELWLAKMEEAAAVKEQAATEEEVEVFIETTAMPVAADAAWASSLREDTQEQLEKLSIATTPWVHSLRDATTEQLEKLSVVNAAWASALRAETVYQLEQLSVGTTAWAIALRRDTEESLERLSPAETAWAKSLRALTAEQLTTLSPVGSDWTNNLYQETKNLLQWLDEGNRAWIEPLQNETKEALKAYEEAARIPEEEEEEEEVSQPQEPEVTVPAEASESDFIASLMAAAEKVAEEEELLFDIAEDYWENIEVKASEKPPELLPSTQKEVTKEVPPEPSIKKPPAKIEIKKSPLTETKADKPAVIVEAPEQTTSVVFPTPKPEPSHVSEAKPTDEWQTARWLWESKQNKEALEIYQRIFNEHKSKDAQLEEELSAWTKTGQATALAYQLLGDLYRRLGRMQDAVAQYREAINRM